VIVCYALSTGMPALRLARKHSIPFVFHVIDALHAIVPVRALQPIAHAVERRIFGAADEVLLINDHLRDYAIRMGAKEASTHVLRTGVDLDRFHPGLDGQQVRGELGIGKDDLVLFFMGWIYSFSGVREVAESLRGAAAPVRLLVVGDGDDYQALCEMQLGLADRLIMTGRVGYDAIPRLLGAADVCLLPFHTVPATEHIVPIKLYEYMAAGKPVIAAPLPGVMRDVGDSNGVTFAPAERQIEKALALSDEAATRGKAARAFVEANCDWNVVTDEFERRLEAHSAGRR
jgi:glycosyltransferase involved in cell wall biosynthesis